MNKPRRAKAYSARFWRSAASRRPKVRAKAQTLLTPINDYERRTHSRQPKGTPALQNSSATLVLPRLHHFACKRGWVCSTSWEVNPWKDAKCSTETRRSPTLDERASCRGWFASAQMRKGRLTTPPLQQLATGFTRPPSPVATTYRPAAAPAAFVVLAIFMASIRFNTFSMRSPVSVQAST